MKWKRIFSPCPPSYLILLVLLAICALGNILGLLPPQRAIQAPVSLRYAQGYFIVLPERGHARIIPLAGNILMSPPAHSDKNPLLEAERPSQAIQFSPAY